MASRLAQRQIRQNNDDERDYWGDWARSISLDFVGTGIVLVIAWLISLLFLWRQEIAPFTQAVFWSSASLLAGWAVGFLFGIPRVLQQDFAPPPSNPTNGANKADGAKADSDAGDKVAYRQQVNTNLEQISDWLTKIIVGVGLIELRNLPGALTRLSGFMSQGATNAAQVQVLAVSIIIGFSILGFLGGYLTTRIYLAGAFERADTSRGKVSVGDTRLSVSEAVNQQFNLSSKLLDQIAKIQKGEADGRPSAAGAKREVASLASGPPLPPVRSILWVDDVPRNNSYLIENLKQKGIDVVTAASTDEALQKLSALKFDRVITDMGRQEGSTFDKTAGIDQIGKIRQTGNDVPIVVYCDEQSVTEFGEKAKQAGAREVTAAPSTLLNALDLP
jgi:CheY-like chemotaxis protein